MTRLRYISLIIVAFLLFTTCKSKKYSSNSKKQTDLTVNKTNSALNDSLTEYEILAKSAFNTEALYLFNETNEYVLCYAKSSKIKFFIYNIVEKNVVFEDAFFDGRIKWIKPYVIQVNVIPKNALSSYNIEKSGYHYMVREKKLIPIQ